MKHLPNTLLQALRYFENEDDSLAFVVALRWPNGVACPHCGTLEPSFLKTRRIWKCKACKKQFSVKVGTIFEDSPIKLDKWLCAIWMIANAKNGVSSYEIHRSIGVTQKTAWFMLQRIRLAMQEGTFELSGEVEIDETYIGGKARNMHQSKRKAKNRVGGAGKAMVMGFLERGGKVQTSIVSRADKKAFRDETLGRVNPYAKVFTDSHSGYDELAFYYEHQVVNHAVEYVRGNVHTNSMENYWSLLKRTISGTYVSVEPFHLFRYLDEQAFRYNTRKETDPQRFSKAVANIVGKRLTYSSLTGKELPAAGA